MSFSYKLHIEDKDFNLLALEYYFFQNHLDNGKPAGGVQGGRIRFLLEVQADTFFHGWMFDVKATHDGKITLNKTDEASKFRQIDFTKAYLVSLAESFSVDTEPALISANISPHLYAVYQWITRQQDSVKKSYVLYCELSAAIITIDGISHNNYWSIAKAFK